MHDDLDALVADVVRDARPGDHVLVMSNGGFGGVHAKLLAALGSEREHPGRGRPTRRSRGRSDVRVIVYLHGFRSSPASSKAQAMVRAVEALPEAVRPRLAVPDLGHAPALAIAKVEALVAAMRRPGAPLTFVGSSLGGFYATHLAERHDARAVLVNPAVRPYDDLAPVPRRRRRTCTRARRSRCTAAHFDELRALAVPRITRPDRYLLLVAVRRRGARLARGGRLLRRRVAVGHGGGDHAYTGFEAMIPAILRFAGVGSARSDAAAKANLPRRCCGKRGALR